VSGIGSQNVNRFDAAGVLANDRRERKPPTRLSAAHLIANLRTEIEEYQTIQSGTERKKKGDEFLADAMRGHFGKKFPITARSIMGGAWT